MSGGELFEKVSDETNRMTEQEAIDYMRQICEGVKHMHENNVVHLDLKVNNREQMYVHCSLNSETLMLDDRNLLGGAANPLYFGAQDQH